MSWSIEMRAFSMALIAATAVLPGTALGAKPILQFHNHFTDGFSEEVCGIFVDVDRVVTDNFFLYADDTFEVTGSVSGTYTNPENGKSVIVSSIGQFTGGQAIVNEEEGTITFPTSSKGLPEQFRTAYGSILTRDAGFITFADTFDLETGDFISTTITINNGPHPERPDPRV